MWPILRQTVRLSLLGASRESELIERFYNQPSLILIATFIADQTAADFYQRPAL